VLNVAQRAATGLAAVIRGVLRTLSADQSDAEA
jgi:hypothetical protein